MATTESSSVAKAGMITGITGLSIASLLALNKGNGGILGGIFGNNCDQTASNIANGAVQMALAQKDAEIAKIKAESYAKDIGTEVYKAAAEMSNKNDADIQANLKSAFQEQVAVRERLAANDVEFKYLKNDVENLKGTTSTHSNDITNLKVTSQATTDAVNALADNMKERFHSVYGAIECSKHELRDAIALESERREAGDQNLYQYVNATFVPGKLIMPRSSICPEVMRQYNSFTVPTGTAPDTQPISGTVTVTN